MAPAQHLITGADVQDKVGGGWYSLVAARYGPLGWQLELLKGTEKHQMGLIVIGATHQGVVFVLPPI